MQWGGQGQVSITVAGSCGDGFVRESESCDGTSLNSATCVSLGYDYGSLSCYSNCSFNTVLCANTVDNSAAPSNPRTEGVPPSPITYNPDLADNFDFSVTKVRSIAIEFKGYSYKTNLEEVGHSAVLKIFTGTETILIHFEKDETKPVDLDRDGVLDLAFTLKDVLTRSATFHIEKIKPLETKITVSLQQRPQQTKLEIPRFEDYGDYYVDAVLILILLILAIINLAMFKKFLMHK